MIAKNKEHRILWLPGEARMWDEDGDSRSSAGVRIDSNNAHQVAAVFACLRVIAETVASLPLHVLERTPGGGKRVARELPLYRQLHAQPNGWQTSFEWREQAVFHVGLWGNAFSELKAGQIVPLHPSRMKVERIENGKIRYKFREDKGTETVYSNEQILQIRGPSDDGINGMSIVEECKDAIALARACELHGARFFAAGARPGFVLSTDGNLNAEAREALRSQWDRRHGGVGNSHNTAVLTGGLKPYEIPQSSNSDAQFLELRRYQLDEIARLFRVPGHLLGSGAGSAQADIEFVQHTILPWLRRFESAFMRDLIDDDRYLVEFDVRGLMRGDSSSRSAYYRAMWDIGVLNTDDIRELENMDPVEGGDVRYRPLNMGTLGQLPTEADVLAQQQPGSGIDGQAVEGGLAAAAGEPVVPAVPGESAETSLTTAEVSSLLTVVKQITDGMLSVDAARAIIAAAFPVLSAARVETILQGVAVKQEEPAPPAAGTPPAPTAGRSLPVSERDCGTGAGGFKPGNKCAGGGDGSDSGSSDGGSSSASAGNDSVDSAGGGADGPAHADGSEAHKVREDHRNQRRTDDYPQVRQSEDHTSVRHTVAEPRYDSRGQYIPPSQPSDWTPERQAMHREIVADATASVPRSSEPTLYMMGGGPAAGKSSIIKTGDVKHPDRHVLGNPDVFKEDIPEYRDGLAAGDHRAARMAHEESSYLNKQVMRAAANNRQDVVWDGTGDNSLSKLESQVRVFREAGFKVQADYVTCDTDTAVQRAKARGEKTGRHVPEEPIRETHARVSEIWPEAVARGLFDRSDLYDTTSGGKPVLIASARGTAIDIKDRAAYQRFLDKAKRGKRAVRKRR
jgi:HK97 family phage portal protein